MMKIKSTKRKIIALLVSVCMLAISFYENSTIIWAQEEVNYWNGDVSESFSGGDGSAENPYLISSAEELALLAKLVNIGDRNYNSKNYKLVNDIYLNNCENWEDWTSGISNLNLWIPIGNATNAFQGNFDGANNVIYGIYIDGNESCVGLFGRTSNASLININISYFFIKGDSSVGGISGSCYETNIDNCVMYGNIYSQGNYAGGCAGWYQSGTVKTSMNNIEFWGNINGVYNVGGIIGKGLCYENSSDMVLDNCNNHGNIYCSGSEVGGIAGCVFVDVRRLSIRNSTNYGEVRGGDNCGGIVGNADTDDGGHVEYDVQLTNDRNLGIVDGMSNTGGLIGYTYPAWGSIVKIEKSYNSSNVKGTSNVGGILGAFL